MSPREALWSSEESRGFETRKPELISRRRAAGGVVHSESWGAGAAGPRPQMQRRGRPRVWGAEAEPRHLGGNEDTQVLSLLGHLPPGGLHPAAPLWVLGWVQIRRTASCPASLCPTSNPVGSSF